MNGRRSREREGKEKPFIFAQDPPPCEAGSGEVLDFTPLPFFSHENGLRENLYKVFFLPISPVAFCLEFSVGSIPKIRALGPAALLLSSARKKRLLEPSS